MTSFGYLDKMVDSVSSSTKYALNNGVEIPVVGFGLYLTDPGVAKDITIKALETGYRHIDSAQYYHNEEEASDAIAEFLKTHSEVKRSDIFYTTKVFDSRHGYEEAKKSIEESLEKAKGIDYIDLFLIHSPSSNREKRLGTWKALEEAVESGKVKAIGVSNYGVRHLKELLEWDELKIKPAINQIELHPWLPRHDIRDYCKQHGIQVEAYSPLTMGKKLNDPELKALAEKHGVTPAQLLLKWSYEQGFVVLCKTVTPSRLQPNFEVPDKVPSLPDDVKKAFDNPDSYEVYAWDPTVYDK